MISPIPFDMLCLFFPGQREQLFSISLYFLHILEQPLLEERLHVGSMDDQCFLNCSFTLVYTVESRKYM